MGNFITSYDSNTEDSDSEVELSDANSDNLLDDSNNMSQQNIQLDAIHYDMPKPTFSSFRNVTSDDLKDVECNLDVYEKISLIYLLCDNPKSALNMINQLNQKQNLFSLLKNPSNEIIEALCIIQNYICLKSLGCNKEDVNARYLPLQQMCSVKVNRFKKFFYRMFEGFTKEVQVRFLQLINDDFTASQLPFPNFQYLEIYFLHFEDIGYLNYENCTNIAKHVKAIDMQTYEDLKQLMSVESTRNLNEMIESFEARSPYDHRQEINIDRAAINQTDVGDSNRVVNTSFASDIFVYPMNEESPGVCLIIENEDFYKEFDERYKHLVIECMTRIEKRYGTHCDSASLSQTFRNMGFKVLHEKNKTHLEIMEIVERVANNDVKEEDSSLFICFLSHGIEGQIIANNCIGVSVKQVENLICTSRLEGKPKVLIMQSCQGQETQKLHEDVLMTDGVTSQCSYKIAPTCDILELWATVPGYAAIRSTRTGSWFIQALCETINNNTNNEHLLDLCTIVQRKVTSMKWDSRNDEGKRQINVMCCNYVNTLTKKLYLPPIKN